MKHPENLVPFTIAILAFGACCWMAIKPNKALDFYLSHWKWHLVLVQPAKSTFYVWHTRIYGVVGMIFFGFVAAIVSGGLF